MLTKEKLEQQYLLYTQRLQKYGCFNQRFIDDYSEKLKICSYSLNDTDGTCYEGSMIDVVLTVLCKNGFNFFTKFYSEQKGCNVSIESLMKVLLLLNISKADLFVPQTNDWKRNKGYLYEFNPNLETSLKLGERTVFICQKYGIKLTEDEYEAIKIVDKEDGDYYCSHLAFIVKMVYKITSFELRNRIKK